MNQYERIEDVIRYVDAHREAQPGLEVLARRAGLSPFHFHRLFSAWAGVTPKDFLQCLTVGHVKRVLREGEPVLEAALGAGLSGPGRLHDLCVGLESASPGEIKSGGAGWKIRAGFSTSPFGRCLVAEGPRGIVHLSFIDGTTIRAAWDEMVADWPGSDWVRDDEGAARLCEQIFIAPAKVRAPRLRAYVRGTKFQVRVWRALLSVSPGQLVTYGSLAGMVGSPRAARAVGAAVAANPIAYLIPCHRVIRETGVVGGYRWGAVRKRAMIGWEGGRR